MKTMEEGYTQQGEFSSADTDEVIKRILIMDDNPDITLTFKKVLQGPQIDDLTTERHLQDNITKGKKKMSFEVVTYNDPFLALSEFKPNFYHLMLVDINMPKINGFEFSAKILERDAKSSNLFYVIRTNKSGGIKGSLSYIEYWMLYQKAHYGQRLN